MDPSFPLAPAVPIPSAKTSPHIGQLFNIPAFPVYREVLGPLIISFNRVLAARGILRKMRISSLLSHRASWSDGRLYSPPRALRLHFHCQGRRNLLLAKWQGGPVQLGAMSE
jgi:hypothetical protein